MKKIQLKYYVARKYLRLSLAQKLLGILELMSQCLRYIKIYFLIFQFNFQVKMMNIFDLVTENGGTFTSEEWKK